MRRFISHTGNNRYLFNIKFQQLKHMFRIIKIYLEHAGIRITLSKHKNQLFLRGFFLVMRRESRRDLRKQPVGEYLRLGTHLPHVNRRTENNGIGMLNRDIKFLHVVVDNTTPIALVAAKQPWHGLISRSLKYQDWVSAPCSFAPSSILFTIQAVLPSLCGLAINPIIFIFFLLIITEIRDDYVLPNRPVYLLKLKGMRALVHLFLSGFVSTELANGHKNQFCFRSGAAMADYI